MTVVAPEGHRKLCQVLELTVVSQDEVVMAEQEEDAFGGEQ